MVVCEVLWHSACAHFRVIQLVVDSAVRTAQPYIQLSGHVSRPNRSVFSDKCICRACIISSRHVGDSISLLVVSVSPAIIEIIGTIFTSFPWLYTLFVYTSSSWHQLSLVQHASRSKNGGHCPSLNCEDGDTTRLRCPLVAVRNQDDLTFPIKCRKPRSHDFISGRICSCLLPETSFYLSINARYWNIPLVFTVTFCTSVCFVTRFAIRSSSVIWSL